MGHDIRIRDLNVERDQRQSAAEPHGLGGYLHLLGKPQPWQRRRWSDDPTAMRDLLGRLLHALPRGSVWQQPLKPGAASDANPFISAGYICLLQFVVRDLVPSTAPNHATAGQGIGVENPEWDTANISPLRRGMLLHVLYGGPSLDAAQPGSDTPGDSNPVLSQLAVLFSQAHNIVAAQVQPVRAYSRFTYARAILQAIYHSIIRCDLLPRLLHPAIWHALNARGAGSGRWLWQEPGVPLELVRGPLRAVHGLLSAGDLRAETFPPLDAHGSLNAHWIMRWTQLFSPGAVPCSSRRIGPTHSVLDFDSALCGDGLSDPEPLAPSDARIAPPAWSVDAMIRSILSQAPDLIPPGWAFATPAARRTSLATWLSDINAGTRCLNAEEIGALADDPPLLLFILMEAGLDPIMRGRCLGVLGSIIVGEVIFKRLAEERTRLEMLRTAAHTALPARLAAAVATIDSMPALVAFVARFSSDDAGRPSEFLR